MAPFVDFEWYRDSLGYELLEPKSRVAVPIRPVEGETLVAHAPEMVALLARPQRIVRRGGELVRYRPLNKFSPRLKSAPCKLFATEAVNPRGLLAFVEKFGPLTRRGLKEKEEEGDEVRPSPRMPSQWDDCSMPANGAIKTRWRE